MSKIQKLRFWVFGCAALICVVAGLYDFVREAYVQRLGVEQNARVLSARIRTTPGGRIHCIVYAELNGDPSGCWGLPRSVWRKARDRGFIEVIDADGISSPVPGRGKRLRDQTITLLIAMLLGFLARAQVKRRSPPRESYWSQETKSKSKI